MPINEACLDLKKKGPCKKGFVVFPSQFGVKSELKRNSDTNPRRQNLGLIKNLKYEKALKQKEVENMARTIKLEGLSEEQVKLVEEFVEFLKSRRKVHPVKERQEDVTFRSWPLGVKGKITREEIYDYL